MLFKSVFATPHVRAVSSALALAACSVATAAQAQDLSEANSLTINAGVDNGTPFRIVSGFDGESLGIAGGSTAVGAAVVQWGYSVNDTNLQWTIQRVDHQKFSIKNSHSGLCLQAEATAGWGSGLDQAPCNGTSNQAWTFWPAANGSYYLVNVLNGWCASVGGANPAAGVGQVFWGCVNGTNQQYRVEPLDSTGAPRFGYRKLHPEKLGFFMIPDFYSVYQTGGSSKKCAWNNVENSLTRLNQLIPNTWIRWDTEVGHINATDANASVTPASVNAFLQCADATHTQMVISAEAVPGYNNYWANGNVSPTWGLLDFAGNANQFHVVAAAASAHPSVQLIETTNEPDSSLFVSDADNASDFAYYLSTLQSTLGGNSSAIVGPATAGQQGNIWNYYLDSSLPNVSYHTYYGCNTLHDVFGKNVYVTEYGGNNASPFVSSDGNTTIQYPSPGWVLADMWFVEHDQHLSNSVQKLFYHQLFDDGGNRGVFSYASMEGNHFAVRDWAKALSMFAAETQVSRNAYFDETTQDFIATDDGNGHTAGLFWNYSFSNYSGVVRNVPGATLQPGVPLFVAHVTAGDPPSMQCYPYSDPRQVWVTTSFNNGGGSPSGNLTVTINTLEPHAAVLVSTQNCSGLAN